MSQVTPCGLEVIKKDEEMCRVLFIRELHLPLSSHPAGPGQEVAPLPSGPDPGRFKMVYTPSNYTSK